MKRVRKDVAETDAFIFMRNDSDVSDFIFILLLKAPHATVHTKHNKAT